MKNLQDKRSLEYKIVKKFMLAVYGEYSEVAMATFNELTALDAAAEKINCLEKKLQEYEYFGAEKVTNEDED